MRVVVFGGATPKRGDPAYEEAFSLGMLLGQAGHTVINGGYTGTMEAVSHGAVNAGAHVIGVTCEEIENWRRSGANRWVKEEWRCDTLDERLRRMMDNSEAAIALPGGVGTLTEIMLYWNRLLVRSLSGRPLIVIGSGWKDVVTTFLGSQTKYLGSDDGGWIKCAINIQEAVALLQKARE